MKKYILHFTPEESYLAAKPKRFYLPDNFDQEGFIHCSLPSQVVETANRHARGRQDLVLLIIDPEKVNAPIRYENTTGGIEKFPHIYGKLNLDAVMGAFEFRPDENGYFELSFTEMEE